MRPPIAFGGENRLCFTKAGLSRPNDKVAPRYAHARCPTPTPLRRRCRLQTSAIRHAWPSSAIKRLPRSLRRKSARSGLFLLLIHHPTQSVPRRKAVAYGSSRSSSSEGITCDRTVLRTKSFYRGVRVRERLGSGERPRRRRRGAPVSDREGPQGATLQGPWSLLSAAAENKTAPYAIRVRALGLGGLSVQNEDLHVSVNGTVEIR